MISIVLLAGIVLAAQPSADDVVSATRSWQERRLKNLQSEDGWLTLVGLGWLKEGSNSAGSGKGVDVEFPRDAPALIGTFSRSGSTVAFNPASGVAVSRGGQPGNQCLDHPAVPTLTRNGVNPPCSKRPIWPRRFPLQVSDSLSSTVDFGFPD